MFLLLRMRRNTINSTSGFKMELKFGFPVPKNIYGVIFCPNKRHLDPFLLDFTIWQCSLGFLAWISGFSPKVRGKNIFFTILTPKRHFLAPKHVLWPMNGQNRCRCLTCADEQELRKKITKKGHYTTINVKKTSEFISKCKGRIVIHLKPQICFSTSPLEHE